jgi:hypothetical protein
MLARFDQVEKLDHYELFYRFVLIMLYAMHLYALPDYANGLFDYAMNCMTMLLICMTMLCIVIDLYAQNYFIELTMGDWLGTIFLAEQI